MIYEVERPLQVGIPSVNTRNKTERFAVNPVGNLLLIDFECHKLNYSWKWFCDRKYGFSGGSSTILFLVF